MEHFQNFTDGDQIKYYLSPEFASHRHLVNSGMLFTLYSIVAIFGFTANAIIFGTLIAIGGMRHNATNIFVASLAFSDMVLCCFNVPFQLYYELLEPGISSTTACKLLFASLGIPTYVSCILILLIAIDRYRSILYPNKPRMSDSIALLLLASSVAFSVISAFPVGYFTELQTPSIRLEQELPANLSRVSDDDKKFPDYCIERWPRREQRIVYSILVLICQFLCPLICTALLYVRIDLWLSSHQLLLRKTIAAPENITSSSDKLNNSEMPEMKPLTTPLLSIRIAQRTRRTHLILVSIVTCFGVCWTPWMLYIVYLEWFAFSVNTVNAIAGYPIGNRSSQPNNSTYAIADSINTNLRLIEMFLKLFALTSTCTNPFLYGWLNENIRNYLIRTVDKIRKSRKSAHLISNAVKLRRLKDSSSQEIINTSCR